MSGESSGKQKGAELLQHFFTIFKCLIKLMPLVQTWEIKIYLSKCQFDFAFFKQTNKSIES